MLKTYTLYLDGHGHQAGLFEPVLCGSMAELLEKAREALSRHPQCDLIDVYFGDTHLFQVRQDGRG